MISNVIQVGGAYIVNYASGRTRLFTNYRQLPKSVKGFMSCHEPKVERYGNTVNAMIWG